MAALILAVGALLAAGIVLAGAPWLSARCHLHPITAARIALALGLATLGMAGGAAWMLGTVAG